MFSSQFERSNDAVFIVEWKTRRILSCNDAVEDIFGYAPEELIGKSSVMLYVNEQQHREFAEMGGSFLGRAEAFRHEFTMCHRDGTVFRSQHLVSPIVNGQNQWSDVLCIVRDKDRYGEHQALTQLATDDSPVSFALTALDSGRVLQANRACRSLFGVGFDEDVSLYTEHDFYVDPSLRRTLIDLLLTQQRIEDLELELRRKDGTHFWASVWASLVSHKREPVILIGLLDVTDRKLALEEAKANEARYRDLTEMAANWFWETDLEGRFTSFLQTGFLDAMDIKKDWTGETRQAFNEALGASPNITDIIQPSMDRKVPFDGVRFAFDHPEMGKTWMTVSGKPIIDAGGRVTGYRGAARNVTNEVKQMHEIEDKEQLLRSILDNAPATIYLKDLEGRYLLANAHLKGIAKSRTDNLIGCKAEDVFDRQTAEAFREQDLEVARTKEPHSYELTSQVPGQEAHLLQVTKFPVFDHQDEIVGVGGINIDITERQRLESELEQMRRLETMGQLTGGVAHDFNNLLSAILSNAEFLAESLDQPALRQAVEAIMEAADQGANLTRDLLSFSRKQRLEVSSNDPKEIAARLKNLLHRTLPAGIELEIGVSDNIGPILVDRRKLENAIINLIVNSRDALEQSGRIQVTMSTVAFKNGEAAAVCGLEPNAYLLVQVKDDGPGIPVGLMEKVLDPYFTTKDPGKGTGLGLSSALGFAQQSGGNLLIASTPGVGTLVSLYLPRTAAPPNSLPLDQDEPAAQLAGRHSRILVVEDDRLVRAGACLLLRQLRYEVVAAENGEEALNILKQSDRPFNLVFADIIMPGRLDGLALAREASVLFPQLRFLLTSGYSEKQRSEATGEPIPFPVLQKPYRKGALLQAVQVALKQHIRLVG